MEAYTANSEPESVTSPVQEQLPEYEGGEMNSGADKHTGSLRRSSQRPVKSAVASQIKTLLLSVAYVFWHFGNFILIEDNKGGLFFISFVMMTFIYGKTVLTKWFKSIIMVAVSILIQNIGQLLLWPSFKNMCDGEVSHWTSLVYAGYHLIIALAMAACAVIMFALLERIGKLLDKKSR